MTDQITIAVGDVHGCLSQLKTIFRTATDHFFDKKIQWIFCGDYVDRGPDSKGVIDFVRAIPDVIALKGNHEDMLVRAWRGDDYLQHEWDHHYGHITTQSFGADHCSGIPMCYIVWMADRPYFHRDTKGRVFVHAGIQRTRPLSMTAQSKEYMIWARHEFLNDISEDGGFVIHGHTPVFGPVPQLYPNRLNLDTGACFGGVLSAAVFDDTQVKPTHFVISTGAVHQL